MSPQSNVMLNASGIQRRNITGTTLGEEVDLRVGFFTAISHFTTRCEKERLNIEKMETVHRQVERSN